MEKFFGAWISPEGVASVMREVEVTRYELISFMNTTRIVLKGIKEELRGIRLTEQNRMTLD